MYKKCFNIFIEICDYKYYINKYYINKYYMDKYYINKYFIIKSTYPDEEGKIKNKKYLLLCFIKK